MCFSSGVARSIFTLVLPDKDRRSVVCLFLDYVRRAHSCLSPRMPQAE
jgi:hypothetical protein